jgi:hypothetical protein
MESTAKGAVPSRWHDVQAVLTDAATIALGN